MYLSTKVRKHVLYFTVYKPHFFGKNMVKIGGVAYYDIMGYLMPFYVLLTLI